MQKNLFYGCATALVTPFKGNRIDFDALENLIDWQIESDIDAIVVLGTTGEPSTITPAERTAIIECAVARCAGRVPLYIGTGSNNTKTAIQQSVEAQILGADGLLAVTPYYNKASRSGLIEHYTSIADKVEIPIIMYNVPSRTGMNMEPETVAELAKHPMLCAIKEANSSIKQLTDLAHICGDGIAIYCGNDDLALPAMALGARGLISVVSNIIPNQMHDLIISWIRNDIKKSRDLQMKYLPLIRKIFEEVSPIPTKAALSLMGKIENTLRLPLSPLDGTKAEFIRRELKHLDLIQQ